jgi:hypothetical protein
VPPGVNFMTLPQAPKNFLLSEAQPKNALITPPPN